MKLQLQSPRKTVKALLKQKPLRSEMDSFKANLIELLNKISVIENRPTDESEEHLKNELRDFLRDTYFKDSNAINTKDKKDLVIHLDKSTSSPVGVIIEAKRPSNTSEMISEKNANKKALHELIWYYLNERIHGGNNQLKQLIVTNINEWYIIDANHFDKHIYRNPQIKRLYETKISDRKVNPWFYEEITKIIDTVNAEIPCTYFDIREYDTILRNAKKEDDKELIALQKILSPQFLLKVETPNDSNSLNTGFYKELLHLIGLEEVKDRSKTIIRRKEKDRNVASLIEAAMEAINTEDVLRRVTEKSQYGANREEQIFNIALELCITWINRILFLKLLEGQLVSYHQGDKSYRFLNSETIHDYDELFKLFHKVLAVNVHERTGTIREKYSKVPYLNSSLFEISELEAQTIKINSLDNSSKLDLLSSTVLKDLKKRDTAIPTLQYIFQFLDAYDFASEGSEEIQEENKSIINASVLGKVFEKINGYKDGSIYTPAFITMYMCRQSIRLAVVQKFNDALSSDKGEKLFDKFEDVKNYTGRHFKASDILRHNEIINSLRICDPAVGSGHFLVSALNEIIAIKAELGILADTEGNSISGYEFEIVNDELIITDPRNRDSTLDYKLLNGKPISKEVQLLQKTLFHEKQTLIENCLFGVDINPNSVKICRLRLWIELLKNAYYKEEAGFAELETLPNIDINIKCGNSLVSRFDLNSDLKSVLKKNKIDIESYKIAVHAYHNATAKDEKRELEKLIDGIKSNFVSAINQQDTRYAQLSRLRGQIELINNKQKVGDLFEKLVDKELGTKVKELQKKYDKLSEEIESIKNNAIYSNAFEWRFEFPEVLDHQGDFVGFDAIIGNPPYVSGNSFKELHNYFNSNFDVAEYQLDLYTFFIELSRRIQKANGLVALITPNSWLKNIKMSKTRKFVLDEFNVQSINPNIAKAFDEAQVDTLILMARGKDKNIAGNGVISIWDFSDGKDSSVIRHEVEQVTFSHNNAYVFDIEVSPALRNILRKIRQKSRTLEDYCEITRGVNPYDKYRGQPADVIQNRLYHAEFKKDETFLPELKGRHVSTFKYSWDNKHYISYGDWLAAPRDPKFFRGGRIVLREILGERFVCAYIEENFIIDRSLYIAIPLSEKSSLKYILGILSSKLLVWLFRYEKNEFDELFPKIRLDEFKKLPIPVEFLKKRELEKVVDSIIALKKEGKDSVALEAELDELVYKIYEITPEEQIVIEGQ